jgi:hypothetical protein
MNIHGYKQKNKGMTQMIKAEESLPADKQNKSKIERLEKANVDCNKRIKVLRDTKKKN